MDLWRITKVIWRKSAYACSMEHSAGGDEREKLNMMVSQLVIGSCATVAVVAGAWVTPEKRAKTQMELVIQNHVRSSGDDWEITAADLARTLDANALMLIGDGERFRVVPK